MSQNNNTAPQPAKDMAQAASTPDFGTDDWRGSPTSDLARLMPADWKPS